LHFHLWSIKKFRKALVDAPIMFWIIQSRLKIEEDIGLELERDLELFFIKKNWSKLSLILFLCFLHCSFTPKAQRSFVALQFACPMTQNLLNLVKEWGKLSQKKIHLKFFKLLFFMIYSYLLWYCHMNSENYSNHNLQ
jgi:hypothetical protein